ncbi:hypothetical protein M758_1G240800 [Ceratodon purpureus]|uniref:Uncharacterized protein n=1 Tax=Ceratodon purpureus TaxID=3225 RepID=A0A8T0JBZ9_CERPU|nr:hypothetical protein KC19_1G245300 [Ceratodon purpureus]KAG0631272.1 hypothetical protein M758_1G240000 [Ceratodon purpureus]KAG0631282.1 hypothetical protein M758_1G240800 [Ceratodon purpureus]
MFLFGSVWYFAFRGLGWLCRVLYVVRIPVVAYAVCWKGEQCACKCVEGWMLVLCTGSSKQVWGGLGLLFGGWEWHGEVVAKAKAGEELQVRKVVWTLLLICVLWVSHICAHHYR